MIKAIIFDFGNVICKFDYGPFISKISGHSPKSAEEIADLIFRKSSLHRLYETGTISSDEFFNRTVSLCDLDISKQNFIQAYVNIFTPINSTLELIKALKENYKIALLSNTNEWHFNYAIKPLEIFELFDAVTLSHEVKAMKPDHKIFEDCLTKLALQPTECIYIDDIKENSDQATKMGMTGIQYNSNGELLKLLHSQHIGW